MIKFEFFQKLLSCSRLLLSVRLWNWGYNNINMLLLECTNKIEMILWDFHENVHWKFVVYSTTANAQHAGAIKRIICI